MSVKCLIQNMTLNLKKMKPLKNVKLSFKCTEDFNKMSACESGRHCSVCNKTVVDFRKSNGIDFEKYLSENKSICGIFLTEQVKFETNNIALPFFKKYAANFLIAIGLGAFNSNLFAQGEVRDTIRSKENSEKFMLGEIDRPSPEYKNGGLKGLNEFLLNNIVYPTDSVFGKVIVTYWVDKNGKVQDPVITQSLSKQADLELLRVVKLLEFTSGNWEKEYVQLPFVFSR